MVKLNLVRCKICNEWFVKGGNHDRSASHLKNLFLVEEPIRLVESAARKRLQTFFLKNQDEKQVDLKEYLHKSVADIITKKIRENLIDHKSLKCNIVVYVEYKKPDSEEGEGEKQVFLFKTQNLDFFLQTELNEKIVHMFESILAEAEDFSMRGSGWTISKILGTELRVNKYNALSKGSSYIPLPFSSKQIVNVQNSDEECFKFAMLGKFLPENERNKFRPSKYEQLMDKYDFSCLNFPVPLKDIPLFEKKNNVSISIFGMDFGGDDEFDRNENSDEIEDDIKLRESESEENDGDDTDEENEDVRAMINAYENTGNVTNEGEKRRKDRKEIKPRIYPLKVAALEKEDHTDLLYVTKGNRSHYCWISNFSGLVRGQLTSHHGKIYICKKCFTHYHEEEKLTKHKILCSQSSKDAFLRILPEKGSLLKFKNIANSITHKYEVYADFESYLREIENDDTKPTYAYQHHTPMSYAYQVVSPDPRFNTEVPVLYRGPDAHVHFVNTMIDLAKQLAGCYNRKTEVIMTDEDKIAHALATHCDICEQEFSKDKPKVRDHDHQAVAPSTSNYRMALCNQCNLLYRHPKTLNVFFHNLSKYDLHFIVKALNGRKERVNIIATTDETYISLQIYLEGTRFSIRFVDSFRFLACSLDKLVSTLPESAFVRTRKLCSTEEQFQMVKRKAPFCYDYVTDESKLLCTSPPPPDAFHNKLNDEKVSNEDYERFCTLWKTFGFRNLGEYVDFYLKLDVTLLSDVFEEFRSFCRKNYNLDCANYLTLPSFAFDAFLKMTKVEIELFHDCDMQLMIESGIRGGISQCTLRHAVANNPLLPNSFDDSRPTTYIQYLDVTALYAYTMCKPLPFGGYEWVSDEKLQTLNVCDLDDEGEMGYILEVDLDYPEKLHHEHSMLPFCCENQKPPLTGSKHKKLMTTLEPKTNYVIHFAALKQALKHGLVLKRIHRAISFKQRPFLKDYIELNARLRQEAHGNKFHQDILKLCSNAVYGKFLENPLKRKNIRLSTHTKQIERYVSRADFVDRKIFDEELVAIHLHRKEVMFNRPMIVGFSILDLSKHVMYKFLYEEILQQYPRDKVELLYMDTDSFIFQFETEDRYCDMMRNLNLYDTSNFPSTNPCYSKTNYKVMGTFKDETGGKPIAEFCGLRSKMYAYRTIDFEDKRAKGVQKSVLKSTVTLDDYLRALYQNQDISRLMRTFRSDKHDVYSVQTKKKALSSFDDKRLVLQGNVVSLPFGHKSLRHREWIKTELKEKLKNFDKSSLRAKALNSSLLYTEKLKQDEECALEREREIYRNEKKVRKIMREDNEQERRKIPRLV